MVPVDRPGPRPVTVGTHSPNRPKKDSGGTKEPLAGFVGGVYVYIWEKKKFRAGRSAPGVGRGRGARVELGSPGQPRAGPGRSRPARLSSAPHLGQALCQARVRPPGGEEGLPWPRLLYPALQGGQEAGWMFAIITQLQPPQSCRHSNGAGRPSRAAKWQEGVRALWAGRGGGGTSPGRSPTGSLCHLPRPPAPSPEARGGGFVWAPRGWCGPGESQAEAPSPLLGARGARGSRCWRAGGARGPCGSGLNLGLMLPPGCPWHTPGPPQWDRWACLRAVFVTLLTCPGSGGASPEQPWARQALWGVVCGRGPGPGAVLWDSANPALMAPIPLHSVVEAPSASLL